MGDLIRKLDGQYAAVILANHGPVVSGKDIESAVYASEELEETARLVLLLRGQNARRLTDAQVDELVRVFQALR
jgi:ribulose-5-phosphate 4-epimerase/fuculose-1-phosphate aldolase